MIISKYFEFDGNSLTYDYWEEMGEIQGFSSIELLADLDTT